MIEIILFAVALILFGLLAGMLGGMLGAAYESRRVNLTCHCGYTTARDAIILGTSTDRAYLAAQLSKLCPICRAKASDAEIQPSTFSLPHSAFSEEPDHV